MGDALSKALADADRSFFAAKAAVATVATDQILATAPGGDRLHRTNTGTAAEQLAAFNGWVFACVHALATRIAGQKVNVGWIRPGMTTPKALPDHELATLLADPNELQIAWSLWYFTVASLELTGKCLWWCIDSGEREQILPIPTSWLTGYRGSTRFESFTIRPPGQAEEFDIDAEEAVYFYYPHPRDLREAASPLQAAGYPVETDGQIQRSQLAAFHNGIFPKHALIVGKNIGPDGTMTTGGRPRLTNAQRQQLVRSVLAIYRGASKDGSPLILDGLIEDVKRLSNTPAEMDWTQSGAAVKARICQIFGVNPIILGEIESANRASSLAAEEHLAATINPKLRLLGDTLTEWLASRYKQPAGKLVVWFDQFTPRDAEMELKKWQLLAANAFTTPDEIRAALLNLPPLPGGLGRLPVQPPAGLSDTLDRELDARILATRGHLEDVEEASRAARARHASNGKGK